MHLFVLRDTWPDLMMFMSPCNKSVVTAYEKATLLPDKFASLGKVSVKRNLVPWSALIR